ncbi:MULTISPECIES: O-aminophenol oxidase PhsA [unclassified Streptomyces]|uniref:O-aminophenol oxidase PhsA n=1 Tax=unclassified Streptomyces TaxID=2593676 RepID=UPI002365E15C|nr:MULTISPECIES: O-aminophenol oxidase PhsA [unclassified Streptomyces]MDF3144959.1 multicopper oxidase domain-containing protein [Streptomyces sp. T21Q-yed]WDF42181.1 multicopper oxidase domain-containing protein [Streptomyces sp. T12]
MTDIIERFTDSDTGTERETDPGKRPLGTGELAPYVAPLPVPPVLRPSSEDVLQETEIALRPTWVRLHPQLPPTLMWGYDGQVPGPTIEVRRGQRVRIAWTNRIPKDSEYPVTSVEVPLRRDGRPQATTEPGREGVEPNKDVAALPAWSVTHLHGAQTGGGNDGWADNAVGFGDAQLSEYPNDHQAVQWWYHDHAMNITRWNVMTGLYGTYLVRDDEEDALHLPCGEREIPLLLADRNLDTDEDGRLNGRLLHKTVIVQEKNPETGKPVSIPFSGPYTTVNGRIWPYAEVDDAWYRFRLVNASNARIYDLVLVDEDDNPVPGIVHQIGSDGGLLPRPVPIDFDGALPTLTAAPAERFDLLVDFRSLAGRKLRLVNKGRNQPPGVPDPAGDVRYPAVMEFRVRESCETDTFELPEVLSGSFRRLTHDIEHGHRLIVLTPPATKGAGGHPEIWEMTEVENPGGIQVPTDGVIQVTGPDGKTKTYRRTARTFNDGLGFTIAEGSHEQWSFLNLAPIVHPMHIHLADFQLLGRDAYDVSGFDPAVGGTRSPIRHDAGTPIPLAPNELGHKDVFRVPGNQMLRVMGRFDGAYGRFMYHCHLLEHEDMGMMRPFVVMPPEALKFDHGGGHGGHGQGHTG